MDRKNLIIIALIVIILILAAGIFLITNHATDNTKVTIKCNSTVYE